jgi:hypothetical protein
MAAHAVVRIKGLQGRHNHAKPQTKAEDEVLGESGKSIYGRKQLRWLSAIRFGNLVILASSTPPMILKFDRAPGPLVRTTTYIIIIIVNYIAIF